MKTYSYFNLNVSMKSSNDHYRRLLGHYGNKKNENYLLISEQTQEMLANKSLDRTNGNLNGISFLSSMFIKEISSLNDEIPNEFPNTFWRYCVGDRSCQNVTGSCGEMIGVNFKNVEKYKNYSKEKIKTKNVNQ